MTVLNDLVEEIKNYIETNRVFINTASNENRDYDLFFYAGRASAAKAILEKVEKICG